MSEVKVPVTNPIDQKRLDDIHMVTAAGPVLIVTHENPDPDSLASGKALAYLFKETWGIPSRLLYSGLVARAENKAMLNILTPEWEYIEELTDLGQYSTIAMVDTQPEAGNNNLPDGIPPGIVMDHHHPLREGLQAVRFFDVRPEVGATVSIVYQYLEAAGIVPDADLATAIFYGIQTDTRSLSRGASPIDQHVYFGMLNMIDHKKLTQIEQAGLPRDYYHAFSQGLKASRIYGSAVVAYLGQLHRPDFIAEMADLLIRLEEARAVLCSGYHGSTLYLSLRTELNGEDAGILIQRVIVSQGKAGGHGAMAGGQVPIDRNTPDILAEEIRLRFLDEFGENAEGVSLLP
jgi:nanoRNase/pAp phosphatase (c-di-AMP/oligoRNAs hydrolase)